MPRRLPQALYHLSLAAEHAIKFVTSVNEDCTSLVFRGMYRGSWCTSSSENEASKLLKKMESKTFDKIRDREEFSNIKEFYPFDFMNKENTLELVNISTKDFKESFFKTSCGWRGKNVLKRNALIKMSNKEDISEVKTDSPYLKDYVHRLLKSNKI